MEIDFKIGEKEKMYVKAWMLEGDSKIDISMDYPAITLHINADVGTIEVRTTFNNLIMFQKLLDLKLKEWKELQKRTSSVNQKGTEATP